MTYKTRDGAPMFHPSNSSPGKHTLCRVSGVGMFHSSPPAPTAGWTVPLPQELSYLKSLDASTS